MHADINGTIQQFSKAWNCFEHNGKPLTKQQVWSVLMYAQKKGYKTTAELKDEEVDKILVEQAGPTTK